MVCVYACVCVSLSFCVCVCVCVHVCSYVPASLPGAGGSTGNIGSVFYPPYSSKYSHSLLFINKSVELNNSCSLDAVVEYSLLVSNASAVFLSEIRVNFYLGTNLPPVVITVSGQTGLEPGG